MTSTSRPWTSRACILSRLSCGLSALSRQRTPSRSMTIWTFLARRRSRSSTPHQVTIRTMLQFTMSPVGAIHTSAYPSRMQMVCISHWLASRHVCRHAICAHVGLTSTCICFVVGQTVCATIPSTSMRRSTAVSLT